MRKDTLSKYYEYLYIKLSRMVGTAQKKIKELGKINFKVNGTINILEKHLSNYCFSFNLSENVHKHELRVLTVKDQNYASAYRKI